MVFADMVGKRRDRTKDEPPMNAREVATHILHLIEETVGDKIQDETHGHPTQTSGGLLGHMPLSAEDKSHMGNAVRHLHAIDSGRRKMGEPLLEIPLHHLIVHMAKLARPQEGERLETDGMNPAQVDRLRKRYHETANDLAWLLQQGEALGLFDARRRIAMPPATGRQLD